MSELFIKPTFLSPKKNNVVCDYLHRKFTSFLFYYDFGIFFNLLSTDYRNVTSSCSEEEIMCNNGVCANGSSKCIYDTNQRGYITGCRDVTHLRSCGKSKVSSIMSSRHTINIVSSRLGLDKQIIICMSVMNI